MRDECVAWWVEAMTGGRYRCLNIRRTADELQLHHKSNDHQSLNVTIISSNFINTIYASRPPNAFSMFCIMVVLSAKNQSYNNNNKTWMLKLILPGYSTLCVLTPEYHVARSMLTLTYYKGACRQIHN